MTDTLRKLAEAATPGPWRKDLGDGNEMRFVSVDDANGIPVVMMDDFLEVDGWTLDQSSIDFIAAANPTAIIALLDEIDALRAKVKALEDAARPPEQWTYGHCREKAKPGGCQLHNLHCNYPDCDRRAARKGGRQ